MADFGTLVFRPAHPQISQIAARSLIKTHHLTVNLSLRLNSTQNDANSPKFFQLPPHREPAELALAPSRQLERPVMRGLLPMHLTPAGITIGNSITTAIDSHGPIDETAEHRIRRALHYMEGNFYRQGSRGPETWDKAADYFCHATKQELDTWCATFKPCHEPDWWVEAFNSSRHQKVHAMLLRAFFDSQKGFLEEIAAMVEADLWQQADGVWREKDRRVEWFFHIASWDVEQALIWSFFAGMM